MTEHVAFVHINITTRAIQRHLARSTPTRRDVLFANGAERWLLTSCRWSIRQMRHRWCRCYNPKKNREMWNTKKKWIRSKQKLLSYRWLGWTSGCAVKALGHDGKSHRIAGRNDDCTSSISQTQEKCTGNNMLKQWRQTLQKSWKRKSEIAVKNQNRTQRHCTLLTLTRVAGPITSVNHIVTLSAHRWIAFQARYMTRITTSVNACWRQKSMTK